MRRPFVITATSVICASVIALAEAQGLEPRDAQSSNLEYPASIVRDINDIAHVKAQNYHDLFYLQGYVHAQDRLFQIDVSRRRASGTLAELLGSSALAQDVQLRTMGLRRAAERSLPLQSTRIQEILSAYADGVNEYVASHPLPPEYAALKLTHFDPWTPVDSLAAIKLIAFAESYQSDIQPTLDLIGYRAAGTAHGFNGDKLFFDDVDRAAPFDSASTVPDANGAPLVSGMSPPEWRPAFIDQRTLELGNEYCRKTKDLELFRDRSGGQAPEFSNEWAISGTFTTTGKPLLANDPHLDLGMPSTWYPVHLQAGALDVIGEGLPGVPVVVIGHNRFVAWGLTDDPVDTWDTFQEKIVSDANSPSGLSTVFRGFNEPIIAIPEIFRFNNGGVLVTIPPGSGIPPVTLIVPRRNNGPIISLDAQHGTALSVQWTGFSGTRELEAVLSWSEARNLKEFTLGDSFFTAPTENVAYTDNRGNIAYFAIGEIPIREDLQLGTVHGLPPNFLRDGTGGNEWLELSHPQTNQATPYEILPASELPHLINPPAGYFVNANNDPAGVTLANSPLGTTRPGGGIYYLAYNFKFGFRSARITQMIRERLARGPVSPEDMRTMQADVKLPDAEVFVPFILQAFANARSSATPELAALAVNPGIKEAVQRLAAWDFTTPTGITEGYDADDPPGPFHPRSAVEIGNSVAATLYSVWRGQIIADTFDAALVPLGVAKPPDEQALAGLRHLLENFSTNQGVGDSGLNFFKVPNVQLASDRRDIILLQALVESLKLLASPAFQNAFGGSTDMGAYNWGKLHRISFTHVLGEPFSVPVAGGSFPQPLPTLVGIPTAGGYQTVNAGNHPVRAANENAFMYTRGSSKRSVFSAEEGHMHGTSSLPGGISGVLGSPFYLNLLPAWLRNKAYDQLFTEDEVRRGAMSVEQFTSSPNP